MRAESEKVQQSEAAAVSEEIQPLAISEARRILQQILDDRGHIVLGAEKPFRRGETFSRLHVDNGERIHGPLVVNALASAEEYQAQQQQYFGESVFFRFPLYYRVAAE